MQHKVASRGDANTVIVVRAGLEIERAVTARRGRVSGYTAFADSTPDISGEQTSTTRSLRCVIAHLLALRRTVLLGVLVRLT